MRALEHGELDVLASDDEEVLDVRRRDVPEPEGARCERCDLVEPEPDHESIVVVSFERAPSDELLGEPSGRAEWDVGAASELRQREPAMAGVERVEQAEGPVDDRLADRRTLAAPDGSAPSVGGVPVTHVCH